MQYTRLAFASLQGILSRDKTDKSERLPIPPVLLSGKFVAGMIHLGFLGEIVRVVSFIVNLQRPSTSGQR